MAVTVHDKIDRQDFGAAIKTLETAVNAGLTSYAGAETVTGIKTFGVMPRFPVNAALAGAGTVQADAAQLAEGITVLTGANGTVGWKLPPAVAGAVVILKNVTAAIAKIWPATGDGINAIAVNSAFSTPGTGVAFMLFAIDATTWYTLPLVPS